MGVLYRIAFYTREAIESLKWNVNEIFRPEVNRKMEQVDDSEIDSSDLELIEKAMADMFEKEHNKPELVPGKTMLFLSRTGEHDCNFLTAFKHRKRIIRTLEWAQRRGISTFLTDYTTPFGLLALETLIKMRDKGAEIRVYAATDRCFGRRKTYRLIKEPFIELAFLAAKADYAYSIKPWLNIADVFSRAGIQCSETGIWTSEEYISCWCEI